MPYTELPAPNPHERLTRLGRLTLKELREILRDRRTIVTLVLMPLLLYPLLTIAFQQFFVAQLSTVETQRLTIGFRDRQEGHYLSQVLDLGGLGVVDVDQEPPPMADGSAPKVIVEAGVRPELEFGLKEYDIHVGLRLIDPQRLQFDPQTDLAVDVEVLCRDDWRESLDAAALIEKHLRAASDKFLAARLSKLGVTQRAVPIETRRRVVVDAEAGSGSIQIMAVIPFILILMTVTGAVYPAIDLTAGERERGTLEILVAAPIPRVGVLFAKYVAVLTVALLTAAANLLTMTITLSVSGLGRLLFGEHGISPGVIAAVFGLLLLFAAFFSAVLLVITSCARSFKEAQAYLIPLMLVSLAPGMLSLLPHVKLSGLLLVTPLANIVLLGRELLALKADGTSALIVVGSTVLYAGAALALAARIFGAESVLYSSQPGWSDLFRRPKLPQPVPTLTAGVLGLAVIFPLYFFLINLLGTRVGIGRQLLWGALVMAVVFGAVPLAICWMRRVQIQRSFRLPDRALVVFAGAVLVGLSLWTIDHELVVLSQRLRHVTLRVDFLEKITAFAAGLRLFPAAIVVLAVAVIPALFEEAFFRGFLFGALRRSTTARTAIIGSALAFGFFHAITPNPLAAERLLSSTLTGIVLGWVRWRTGSVLPGLLLHACHNGLLVLLMYFEPELTARNIGVSSDVHLSTAWSIAGVASVAVGAALIAIAGRPAEADVEAPLSIQ
ncbi:MAG: CPBP family intramembrane metalloprotease [Planctomycetaceae bacterium]|nr:CPBP family intramembrane metalloprotease [Planctomycetaceae bacterium]